VGKLNRRHFLLNAAGAATGLAAGLTAVEYATGGSASCPVIAQLRREGLAEAGAVRWTPSARARLARVPAGFMRSIVEKRSVAAAIAEGRSTVDLELACRTIDAAKRQMNEAVAQAGFNL
jgi:histone H3/H4